MTDEEASALIAAAIKDPAGHGLIRCSACGLVFGPETSFNVGVFFPNEKFTRRIAPRNKYRVICYAVCDDS